MCCRFRWSTRPKKLKSSPSISKDLLAHHDASLEASFGCGSVCRCQVLVGQALLPVRVRCGDIMWDRQECLSYSANCPTFNGASGCLIQEYTEESAKALSRFGPQFRFARGLLCSAITEFGSRV